MPATKEYNKKYYEEHKDYYHNYCHQYSIEHREEIRERHRRYREENVEKLAIQRRVQYDKQSERLRKKAIEEAEARTRLTEIWKPLPGYENIYEVSSWGWIRSLTKRGVYKYSKGSRDKDGYYRFVLRKDGVKTKKGVHYLVAITFIPIPPELMNLPENEVIEVHHINENKGNNLVWNLMWVTKKMNLNAGTRTERAVRTRRKNKKDGI